MKIKLPPPSLTEALGRALLPAEAFTSLYSDAVTLPPQASAQDILSANVLSAFTPYPRVFKFPKIQPK